MAKGHVNLDKSVSVTLSLVTTHLSDKSACEAGMALQKLTSPWQCSL